MTQIAQKIITLNLIEIVKLFISANFKFWAKWPNQILGQWGNLEIDFTSRLVVPIMQIYEKELWNPTEIMTAWDRSKL